MSCLLYSKYFITGHSESLFYQVFQANILKQCEKPGDCTWYNLLPWPSPPTLEDRTLSNSSLEFALYEYFFPAFCVFPTSHMLTALSITPFHLTSPSYLLPPPICLSHKTKSFKIQSWVLKIQVLPLFTSSMDPVLGEGCRHAGRWGVE